LKRTYSGLFAALAVVSLLVPLAGTAQSTLDRTPNLSGAWAGREGTVHFHFLHRFALRSSPESATQDRIEASPTFLLAYPLASVVLVGGQYATSSRTVPDGTRPNEWEAFMRLNLLPSGGALPLELSLTGAYNGAARSPDAEISAAIPIGRATLMGVARAFGDGYGSDTARIVLGTGVRLRLTENMALAGDFLAPLDRRPEEVVGWGAALQLRIPDTPHTLSLQVANTSTATLQGSSRGVARASEGGTRWGFEFTVPLTLSRMFGDRGRPARDRTLTADTMRVAVRDHAFSPERLVVPVGTTVVWENVGDDPHTSTSPEGAWESPILAPGESYARVFGEAGEYRYHCELHPAMTGVVVVGP